MKLTSINIVSANPNKLADFYRKVLGAEINEAHGGPNRIEIWFGARDEGAVLIVANYDKDFRLPGTNACQGFELRVEDVDALYERLCGMGVEPTAPPKDLPWGYRYFNIKDPDGNGIDLVQAI